VIESAAPHRVATARIAATAVALALVACFAACATWERKAPQLLGPPGDRAASIVWYAHAGDPYELPPQPDAFLFAAWDDGAVIYRPQFDSELQSGNVEPEVVRTLAEELWTLLDRTAASGRVTVASDQPGLAISVRWRDAERLITFSSGLEVAEEADVAYAECVNRIQARLPSSGVPWDPSKSVLTWMAIGRKSAHRK
jgi:hypothetical protein